MWVGGHHSGVASSDAHRVQKDDDNELSSFQLKAALETCLQLSRHPTMPSKAYPKLNYESSEFSDSSRQRMVSL